MKKNITINLCGRLFQIDEDAYEMLQEYIESLRSSFGKQEGCDEIVNDIEARIAELFAELNQQGIEAITIDHVKDIITRIGKPEELTDNEGTDNGRKDGHKYESFRSAAQDICDNVRARTAGKKLYRNPNDKMVAGVLSGLAAYTNSDAVWWRLLTVLLVLFYGVGIIAYIVMAIVVPEAKTPEQLLQMEGKEVTPQNLADVVVENKQTARPNRGCLGTLLFVLFSIVAAFFVVIASIVGVGLLISLLLVIVSLVIVFTVPSATHVNLPFDIEYLNLGELINIHALRHRVSESGRTDQHPPLDSHYLHRRCAARPLHTYLCHRPHAVLQGWQGATYGHRTAHPVDRVVGGVAVLSVPCTHLDSATGENAL